jgi:hypothetical protein
LKDISLNIQGIMRTDNVSCQIIVTVITLLGAEYYDICSFSSKCLDILTIDNVIIQDMCNDSLINKILSNTI